MDETISDRIARHVEQVNPATIPPSALHMAKRVLLDASGVMLGASGLSGEARPFLDLAKACGQGPSRILGTGDSVPAPAAALANGALAHALDFEDAFELSPGHPNASLVPALLALAQAEGPVDGPRFLAALAVGGDISCRLALALNQPMEAGGWYPPPILAGFGAVSGAANLLGLDAVGVRAALSLMLCQVTMPGEIKYSSGTQIRAVREAFPAQAAVLASLLARSGVTGFEEPLEGRSGFYALYANGNFDPSALIGDLGSKYWTEQLTFKPWPSCRGTHAFIEMALDLRREHGFSSSDIIGVEAAIDDVHEMLFEPTAVRRTPSSAIEAKFSIPFCLSLALVRGRVTLDDFGREDLEDPEILDLAARIRPVRQSSMQWEAGRGGALALRLHPNRTLNRQVDQALGCPENPLSDAQLTDKFVLCAGKAANPMSGDEARRLADQILTLENCADVGALF